MTEQLDWRISSFCHKEWLTCECVELAVIDGAEEPGVALRNSTDPGGTVLEFSRAAMGAFLEGVSMGEFDDLAATASLDIGGIAVTGFAGSAEAA